MTTNNPDVESDRNRLDTLNRITEVFLAWNQHNNPVPDPNQGWGCGFADDQHRNLDRLETYLAWEEDQGDGSGIGDGPGLSVGHGEMIGQGDGAGMAEGDGFWTGGTWTDERDDDERYPFLP